MAKKQEFDFKRYLVGKLRAATRNVPWFNECKKNAKVNVTAVFCEEDMTLTGIPEDGSPSFTIKVYKKAQSRERNAYRCAKCGRLFFDYENLPSKKGGLKKTPNMAIDHVDPIVALDGFEKDPVTGDYDWTLYIRKMFFGKLQLLCNYKGLRDGVESCHHIKTREEKIEGAKNRKRKEKYV